MLILLSILWGRRWAALWVKHFTFLQTPNHERILLVKQEEQVFVSFNAMPHHVHHTVQRPQAWSRKRKTSHTAGCFNIVQTSDRTSFRKGTKPGVPRKKNMAYWDEQGRSVDKNLIIHLLQPPSECLTVLVYLFNCMFVIRYTTATSRVFCKPTNKT